MDYPVTSTLACTIYVNLPTFSLYQLDARLCLLVSDVTNDKMLHYDQVKKYVSPYIQSPPVMQNLRVPP